MEYHSISSSLDEISRHLDSSRRVRLFIFRFNICIFNCIKSLITPVFVFYRRLRNVYENSLNELSPLERAAIEQDEENQIMSNDVSALATTSLEQSERVQKATVVRFLKCFSTLSMHFIRLIIISIDM